MAETPPKLKEKLPAWIAAAAATMTTTIGLSYFGVAGTLIGVGLGSIITGVGATLYERWIRDAHAKAAAAKRRLAEKRSTRYRPAQNQADRDFERMLNQSYYRPVKSLKRFDIPWKRVLIISGSSLAICLVIVAVIELIAHKPLAAVVTGHRGNGTSFSGGTVQNNPRPSPSYVQPTPTVVPSPTVTVTVTPSPSPSVTVSPASAGPSETVSPSPSPSPSPTQEETSVPANP